jgi:hypothetical protein
MIHPQIAISASSSIPATITFECMFDKLVADAAGASSAAAVGRWAREEAAACARRLAAMVAMLDVRHAADGSARREQWYLDNWGAVSAEIGAAQNITAGSASHQLLVATALRDRLPRVAAVFAEGLVTYRTVAMTVSRTLLIRNPDALRAVDTALAEGLQSWAPMSVDKTTAAIDALIAHHDPYAVRRTQTQARNRSVDVYLDDASGLASLWGTLFAHDAKALDKRIDTMARATCEGDPRTLDQRRADALGALAHGTDCLRCLCGVSDCAAAIAPLHNPGVVFVVTHDDTLTSDDQAAASQDAALDGDPPPRTIDKPLREQTLVEALSDDGPGEPAATRPGAMMGGPLMPGALIRRMALQSVVRKVFHPGDSPPEPRYAPSRRLADFVRCRDLTCRFPGCDVPATNSDVDHTIPYPVGPTCASNLKCLCRFHHLLKTFWGGPQGWRDRQLPDGTVVWRSPGGQTYTTQPGSRLLFPTLCLPTAKVATNAAPSTSTAPASTLTMPRRGRTRAEDRAGRINDERRLNAAELQDNSNADPPPF